MSAKTLTVWLKTEVSKEVGFKPPGAANQWDIGQVKKLLPYSAKPKLNLPATTLPMPER